MSYFLGYFWADGYISSNQDLFMEIVKDDADDIEHIFMKVCSFHRYERNRVNRKAHKTFHYTDYERNITSLLTKLGKYPKTIESHENIMKYIPKQYLNYFIRGLFDGDGSLYVHNNTVQITISGRYEQDWSYLVNFLNKEYNINFKINLRTYKSFKSSHIRNVNPKSIINFLKQIYDVDDGIYLNRKYNKIKQLICKQ